MNAKVRSNVYLDKTLKIQAMQLFKEYGLSLSDGINFLLKKALEKQVLTLDIKKEIILPNDPDYQILENAKKHYKQHPENYVNMNDINWD